MFDRPETPHWPDLLRPLADASTALGRLAHALETTPLHQAWLWRETARASARISQIGGYRINTERLCQSLAGLPLAPAEDDSGLAAARRVFLVAAPLFRHVINVDSDHGDQELFEPLWRSDALSVAAPPQADSNVLTVGDPPRADDPGGQGRAEDHLLSLVRELVGFAGQARRPALLDLLLDLHRHGTPRRLPPSLARLALPLALHRAGVVPKAAPGLLGGRLPLAAASPRLSTLDPLATTGLSTDGESVTAWLARALTALAKEAEATNGRLHDLTRQHRAWHEALRQAGPRGHSRAPAVLDLLAITPVLSASLVARHVGCTPQGASGILQQLAELGVVTQATSRARWKIFLASDLALAEREALGTDAPVAIGASLPDVDRDAIETTLDVLFAELERTSSRARERAREGGS